MQKPSLIFILILFITSNNWGQMELAYSLYNNYERYKESTLETRRFKHSQVEQLIQKFNTGSNFRITREGESLEKRSIYLMSIGTGKINVLAWSQMHGDESTATMALFDIFNFLTADDEFNDFRKNLLSKVTLNFIPLLNPDGAERFTRRNALQIDLNRDAIRIQLPETKILKSVRDKLDPEFGFNLHDQDKRYSAGKDFKSATISFLAPAFNFEKEMNSVRENTMKLIVNLYDILSEFIPGHIARYDDEYEPRAFGDNMVKWGTSSVLIESGGWKNDTEKQFIRKMNFIALLSAFNSISKGNYANAEIERYFTIPENEKLLFDLLLRNLNIEYAGNKYIVDVGIRRTEKEIPDKSDFYYESTIEDFGDLSVFYGYEDYDCTGLEILPGNIYPETLKSFAEIKQLNIEELLRKGYLFVNIPQENIIDNFTKFPINIIVNQKNIINNIELDRPANFLVKEGDKIRFAIVNGFIYDVNNNKNLIQNGLIFK